MAQWTGALAAQARRPFSKRAVLSCVLESPSNKGTDAEKEGPLSFAGL